MTETQTLHRPRFWAGSSSWWVEETVESSGLPRQASIAGQSLRLEPTAVSQPEPSDRLGQGDEVWEAVIPDTDRAYTMQQMAQAWQAIARPISEDDVPLAVDPDEYPLF